MLKLTVSRFRQGGRMAKRISRIAPWQAGKLFAVIYFVLSLVFVIPMGIAIHFAPTPPNGKPPMSPIFLVFLPFLYALGGLVFVPLACWIYNTAAKWVGGLQITVTDDVDV
jgi:hypothetical protein